MTKFNVMTIGDARRDIFVFPSLDEIERPIDRESIQKNGLKSEKFFLLGYGEKITLKEVHYEIGGSACNVAVGLSKLGLKTSITSAVGGDDEGRAIIQKLEKSKVDASHLVMNNRKKTSSSIILSYEAERSILVYYSFGPNDFKLPKDLNSEWIYVGPLGKDYQALYGQITSLASEKDIKIAINPGSLQIKDGPMTFGGLLRVAKILFLNREEAQRLSGLPGIAKLEDIFRVLQKTGVETIVITDGNNGAAVMREDEYFKIGTYKTDKVEVTGAGDAFSAAFLSAYIRGEKLFECLKWGAVSAASVIGQIGAQEGLLSASAIKSRLSGYRWSADSLKFSK